MSITRTFAVLLFSTAGVFVAACVILISMQQKLVFFPNALQGHNDPSQNPQGTRSPGEYKVEHDDIKIDTPDGVKIHLWVMKQPEPKECATIIFFQGNAGNMGFRLPNLVQMYRKLGANIVAPSYRGYGFSAGTPSEKGLYIDAQTVLDYVLKRSDIDPMRIFLFGRSLGGAIAIHTVHKNADKIAGLMVENTFWSIKDMALQLFPFFKPLSKYLDVFLTVKFPSGECITKVEAPVLFILGTDDTLVPPRQMKKLYEACGSSAKRLLLVNGGAHNNTWQLYAKEYYDALRSFMMEAKTKTLKGAEIREIGTPASADYCPTMVDAKDIAPRAPTFYEGIIRQLKAHE